MFLRYLDFVFRPFRKARASWVRARNLKGGVLVDVNRAKSYKKLAGGYAKRGKQNVSNAAGKFKKGGAAAQGAAGKVQGAMPGGGGGGGGGGGNGARGGGGGGGGGGGRGGVQPQMPGGGRGGGGGGAVQPQMPGGGNGHAAGGMGRVQGQAPGGARAPGGGAGGMAAAGAAGAVAAQGAAGMQPGIKKKGFLFWKKHFCTNCGERLDKSWDACPYCAQPDMPMAAPAGPARTQAIQLDAAGTGRNYQMLGWLVPLAGPQRGELYTLAPISSIGTEDNCTVVLLDKYMSAVHAEIKAEGGAWILRDLGSTNGTYVNDRRVDMHELVDNDFIKFGQSLVKFKSL